MLKSLSSLDHGSHVFCVLTMEHLTCLIVQLSIYKNVFLNEILIWQITSLIQSLQAMLQNMGHL